MTAEQEIRSYRLDPAGLEPALKARQRWSARWGLLAVVVGALPVAVLFTAAQREVLVVLPFTIPLTIVIAAIVLSRVRRQTRLRSKQDWESYQLTMSRNVLRRFVASLPAVEILRPEVSRILDSPGQGLSVVANPSRFIFIPEQLIGYASVREQLASWRAFEPARAARAELTRLGWTLLMLSLWVATGMLPQFWLGMLAGAALLVVASLSLRATLKLQVFDNKYKARAVGALGFFMLAPFARALLHFGFGMDVVWPQ